MIRLFYLEHLSMEREMLRVMSKGVCRSFMIARSSPAPGSKRLQHLLEHLLLAAVHTVRTV